MSESLGTKISRLQPLVNRRATVEFNPRNKFSWCLTSAFTKAFEFVELASRPDQHNAYFLTASLRSITEEIIFLRFIFKFPDEDREFVIGHLVDLEVIEEVKRQTAFFGTFRPFQPVLSGEHVEENRLKEELRDFWRKNGWPNFNRRDSPIVPPTRQIAEKSGEGLLEIVYDFIFRLSSMAVHFNPRILLSLGWGDIKGSATFSSRNMGHYHQELIQVYGTYLFCLYFELFQEQIGLDEKEKEAVADVRNYLQKIPRWPEMVTFEEMNLPVPDIQARKWPDFLIHAMYSSVMKEGFISGATEILRIQRNVQDGHAVEDSET